MSFLRRWIGPRSGRPADPTHPIDMGLPLGAFKICDRQVHVIESWAHVCSGCLEGQGAARPSSMRAQVAPAPPALPEQPDANGGPKATTVIRANPSKSAGDAAPVTNAFPMWDVYQSEANAQRSSAPSTSSGPQGRGRTEAIPSSATERARRRGLPWGRLILELELRETSCRLGASQDLEVPLAGDGIAPHHATLQESGGEVQIFLPTRSGTPTLVNGHPISSGHTLRDGDQIQIGMLRLRYERAPSGRDPR